MSTRRDAEQVKPKSRARRLTTTLLVLSVLGAAGYALATRRIPVSAGK